AFPVCITLQLIVSIGGAGMAIVDEDDAVAHKHLIVDLHAFADEAVGLNLAPFSDACAALNLDERPDPGLVANLAPVQVDEGRKPDLRTKLNIWSHQPQVRQRVSLIHRSPIA